MRIPALLLVVALSGCGSEEGDRPGKVVRAYLQAKDAAACQHLTAAPRRLCRRPRVPETRAAGVVIEGVRIHEDRAAVRASYNWTGYRRHSTFALVRRNHHWLIACEAPD
jgi:hypothetical protein